MNSIICIIIPCFNEALRLPISTFEEYLADDKNKAICLYFVNDRSSDDTIRVLDALHDKFPRQTKVVDLVKNQGKAEAVRAGIQNALADARNFSWFGYFDADLATPLAAIQDLYDVCSQKNFKFVLGSRVLLMGHRIERVWYRHYFGRIFGTVASILLNLPVYDTQCGAKLLHKSITEKVFKEPFLSPWLFDIEILARVIQYFGKNYALQNIVEFPLNEWIEQHDSKIKPSHLLKLPLEFYKIYEKYKKYL